MGLAKVQCSGKTTRVIGIDDAHYRDKTRGAEVHFSGVVCAGTRFEGMIWSTLEKDGLDASERITQAIRDCKFFPQLHLVLLDGITFGGCNIVDLKAMANELGLPTVAVMRRRPKVEAFQAVFNKIPDKPERLRRIAAAGPIYELNRWVFQCHGEDPETIATALTQLTDTGKVPEALRLAHLIGSAIKLGESTNRA